MSNEQPTSVFSKIVQGKIPSHKVYESDTVLAIMDIYPISEGMVVVFPKLQIANVEDLPESVATDVMATVHKVMRALRVLYPDATKIGVQVAGFQTPDHAHFTVFPANTVEEYHAESPTSEPDHAKLEALAQKIRQTLA